MPGSRRQAGLVAPAVLLALAAALAPVAGARTIDGSRKADRLSGGRAADLIRAGPGNDRLSGGRGPDRLFGGPGSDRIGGGPGNDRLDGGSGNDDLDGGSGNDRVSGGPGRDRVRCGRGRDSAVAGRGDRIGRDCERIVDSRGRRIRRALDIDGAQPPGTAPPPGKRCHTEIRTVLVQKGTGIHAPFVLEPQVVLICGSGGGGGGAPQCSDGRDNDGDGAVDHPQDRGCSSRTDDREYPDPVSPVEQLLTSRNGFWWVQADGNPGGSPTCSLYVFRTTPQGDRLGTRQDFYLNPISGICLLSTSGAQQTFTWSTTEFAPPAVVAPYSALGTRVRLQYIGGATVLLWIFARDASRDLLVYTVNKPPGQTSNIGLWGCTSASFPAVFRPPGC